MFGPAPACAANGMGTCNGSPCSPKALPGMARLIPACRRSPLRLPAPVGMGRGSSACATSHRSDPQHDASVDRLTLSLADFAKLVELFDQHNVSFVSVTQQCNIATSMSRLTLNVLLSFAQFEREVTSERIRDKISASKRKGLWVGGMAPLGYDTKGRKITINEPE